MSKRKKLTGGADHPPAKKVKTESEAPIKSETPNENDDAIIRFQKDHMLLRIKELNREMVSLREFQNNFQEEKLNFNDRISIIDQQCLQMSTILSRILINLPNYDKPVENKENAAFLDKLSNTLKGTAPSILINSQKVLRRKLKKETVDDQKELEKFAEFSKKLIETIVQSVNNEHERLNNLHELILNAPNASELNQVLTEENKTLRAKIKKLKDNNMDLELSLSESQREVKECKSQITTLKANVNELSDERDSLESKLILKERQIDKLSALPQQPSAVPPAVASAIASTNKVASSPKVRFKQSVQQNTELSQAQEENTALREKFEEVNTIAESRLKEIQQLSDDIEKCKKEILQLKQDLSTTPEDRIVNSFTYQNLNNKLQQTQQEFRIFQEASTQKLNAAKDSAANLQRELEQVKQTEGNLRNSMKDEIAELQKKITELTSENTSLTEKINSQPEQNTQTYTELNAMIATQLKELKKLRSECNSQNKEKNKYQRQIADLKKANQKQLGKLAHQQLKTKELDSELNTMKSNLEKAEANEKYKLQEEITLLRQVNEKLQHNINAGRAAININIEDLIMRNKKVQGLDRKIRELNSKYDKSERQSKEQQKLLSEQKQECSSYIKEIEEIGKELEELQNQNARILQQLSEKDDCNNRLIKDCIDLKQKEALLVKEKELADQQCDQLSLKIKQQDEIIQEAGGLTKNLKDQFNKLQEENKSKLNFIEEQQKQVTEMSEKLLKIKTKSKDLKMKLEESKKATDDIFNFNKETIRARYKEKELALQKKVDKLKASRDSVTEEELRNYKKMTTCPVCNEKEKNVVIAKCFHVFCKECIQSTLTARNRRCPQCAKPFSDHDVHDIYLNFHN